MFKIQSFLSHVFLFETLTSGELEALAAFCSARKMAKDEVLFHEGQFVDAFYIIAFGKIKIYRLSPNGAENIIHHQEDGDLVAEAAIFDDERYPANAVTTEETLAVKVPSEKFKALLKNNPELCFKIMSAYAKRLRFFTKKIQELTLSDIKGRLAGFLLSHQENKMVTLTITKKELASTLGTIPETLSRTLKGLKEQGLIEVNKDKITLLNLEELKALTL